MLLLYRSNNSSHQTFNDSVSDVVPSYCIDIVLGAFNIDAYDSEQEKLVGAFSCYETVVNDATHISGSLLD